MGEIALAFSPVITNILGEIMSDVSAHLKDKPTNEIMIIDLTVPYATIWHSGATNATRIDMHIKLDEAKALYEALQEVLKVHPKGQSGDKSLPTAKTPPSRVHAAKSS
jgi:hypothetical protein